MKRRADETDRKAEEESEDTEPLGKHPRYACPRCTDDVHCDACRVNDTRNAVAIGYRDKSARRWRSYNRDVRKTTVTYGQKTPVACKVAVPAVGCILGYDDSGYGDGSRRTYIVIGHALAKDARKVDADGHRVVVGLRIALVVKIDIGKGHEAVADPVKRAGHVSYAAEPWQQHYLRLCYAPSENEATYAPKSHSNGWYHAGEYYPMDIGFDK